MGGGRGGRNRVSSPPLTAKKEGGAALHNWGNLFRSCPPGNMSLTASLLGEPLTELEAQASLPPAGGR